MTVSAGIGLALQLLEAAARVSALVRKAQEEGRTDLTADEWASVLSENDAARAGLVDAIDKAS